MARMIMEETKPFFFKQFKVAQDKVVMKVGTDGVLLGAWIDVTGAATILDVGTGSGLIALQLAQRLEGKADIHGIDIDPAACEQARENFTASPWGGCMTVIQDSIQDYSGRESKKYELIVSNPPFFTGGLLSQNPDKNDARHTTKLPHGDLLRAVSRLLKPEGRLGLILPYLQGLRFIEISESYSLFPLRITEVRTREDKPVERMLIEFTYDKRVTPQGNTLVIHQGENDFTPQYKDLTRAFYLNF